MIGFSARASGNVRKVLIVASRTRSLVNFRGDLIRAMQCAGCVVSAAVPLQDGSLPEPERVLAEAKIQAFGLSIDRTGMNPLADLNTMGALRAAIASQAPDLLFAYTAKPVIYGLLLGWLLRVPQRVALITGLGYHFTGMRHGIGAWILRSLYRIALARATLVFFQNPDDQALFRELGLLPRNIPSCVVNGSGINLRLFDAQPLREGPPVFLLIARLLGDKGVREYVAAAKKMKARNAIARFQLAGWIDGNPDSISKEDLESWIQEGDIEYLGKLADVRPALAACHVYVLPSYREGTPRTVLEAMATGRAIITTDAPGCRETVLEGENGFLVPVKSIDSLDVAMRRFIDTPELIESMGRRSREIAEEKYDVHKVNAVMLDAMGIAGP